MYLWWLPYLGCVRGDGVARGERDALKHREAVVNVAHHDPRRGESHAVREGEGEGQRDLRPSQVVTGRGLAVQPDGDTHRFHPEKKLLLVRNAPQERRAFLNLTKEKREGKK